MERSTTIPEMFVSRAAQYADRALFKTKAAGRYYDISWTEALQDCARLSLALSLLGIRKDDKVCVLSESRLEWIYFDLALLSLGAINVPIFPTYSRREIEYIIQHSEARTVVVSTQKQWQKIERLISRHPGFYTVICLDVFETDCKVYFYDALVQSVPDRKNRNVASYMKKIKHIDSSDSATIIYTSGTTGPPKGVMLTHRNFLENCAACARALQVSPDAVALSVLPLSHVFERLAGYYLYIYQGVTIAFAENLTTIAQNLQEIKPYCANFVPRIFEKMYHKILGSVSAASPIKQKLFYWAHNIGKQWYVFHLKGLRPSLWFRFLYGIAYVLVYRKIRALFGGHIRFLVSGGAKLSREIARFYFAAGILILEGYGLTETSPVVSVNRIDKFKFGTIGIPLDNLDVTIADDGEILVRGPSVMKGYYKDAEATRAVIRDGWFYTGDLGSFDENGYLKITGRKKELLVMSSGKNVSPQNLENTLNADRFINQVFVCGDGEKYLAALIVPDIEQLEQHAAQQKIPYTSIDELINTRVIYRLFTDHINEHNTQFPPHERIKKFHLLCDEFSPDKGELTPTLKLKRSVIMTHYKKEINTLFRRE